MGNWVNINELNTVINIIVADNDFIQSGSVGDPTKWFEEENVGIGWIYNSDRNQFYAPQPFPSWILDQDTLIWNAPVTKPSDGYHMWDEEQLNWIEVFYTTSELE